MSQNMDSISEFNEHGNNGNRFIQNLNPTSNTQASKLPQAIQDKLKYYDPQAFQIKNKDTGEVINFYEYDKIAKMQEF